MILVTGAGGFIGRCLVSHFVSRGLDVVPFYHAGSVNIRNDRWEANLTRPDHISVLKNTKHKPKTVIHLAGHIEIVLRTNPNNPLAMPIPGAEDFYRIYMENVVATANLLDLCLHVGVNHLIFASSQAVYGMPETDIITEKSPCVPLEHYANSKLCCEQLLQVGARQGIAVTVLRIPGVYSEERQNGAVYKYCKAALHEKRITVTTNVPLPLDVIYIGDVVNGFEKAVRHGGKRWQCLNLATGEPCSLNLLADAVAELMPGCQVEHGQIPQPVIQMDSSRAYTVLGWKAIPRRQRLQLMLDRMQKC